MKLRGSCFESLTLECWAECKEDTVCSWKLLDAWPLHVSLPPRYCNVASAALSCFTPDPKWAQALKSWVPVKRSPLRLLSERRCFVIAMEGWLVQRCSLRTTQSVPHRWHQVSCLKFIKRESWVSMSLQWWRYEILLCSMKDPHSDTVRTESLLRGDAATQHYWWA